MSSDCSQELRVDRWLWFARLFKSRSQATQAVAGGRVHVNGERARPSRLLHAGDMVRITLDERGLELVVTGIPVRRGPASEARTHYAETAASIAERERRSAQARFAAPAPEGRPDKHDRRTLRDLRRG